jgi:hypothetical protein
MPGNEFKDWQRRKTIADRAVAGTKNEHPTPAPSQPMTQTTATSKARAVGQTATDGQATPPEVQKAKEMTLSEKAGLIREELKNPFDEETMLSGYESVPTAEQYQVTDLFSNMPSL